MKQINSLQIFSNDKFGNVRAILIAEIPYFVGRDVAKALGYAKPENAIKQHVDSEDTLKQGIPDNQGNTQQTTLINESGVYSLVFGSKLQDAKNYKKWVTSEVLPAIRKSGGYIVSRTDETDEDIMARALIVAQETIKKKEERMRQLEQHSEFQQQIIDEYTPKVEYHDAVISSDSTFTANQIAKEFGMSAISLNHILQQKGVQYKQSGQWLLHYKYQDKGYTKTATFTKAVGDSIKTYHNTVWTEKGRQFIHSLLSN